MEDLLSQWRNEQYQIALETKILEDDHEAREGCPGNAEFSYLSQTIQDKLVGGVDVSFGDGDTAIAVYIIARNHKVLYTETSQYTISVPYVSSYLAFREIEPITQLVRKQKSDHPELTPQVILVDGNGILHERKAGLATFVGVRTGIPTIGIGKTIYCTDGLSVDLIDKGIANSLARFAEYCENLDGENKKLIKATDGNNSCVIFSSGIYAGSDTQSAAIGEKQKMNDYVQAISSHCNGFAIPLRGESGDVLGAALLGHGGKISARGQKKQVGTKNPIFISIGSNISLQDAASLCVALSLARIPEPVRQADLIGRGIMRAKEKKLLA